MSHRLPSGTFVICPEPPAKCETCGKEAELRPYGPRGERICYECGLKNPASTMRQMHKALTGEDIQ